MRDDVQQSIRQFQSGDLPRDAEFYQHQREKVALLVSTLERDTGRSISWEPPMELFNFYHLQLPTDPDLVGIKLYGKANELMEYLEEEKRPLSFLHLLVSPFSAWVYCYWQRFERSDGTFKEVASTEGPLTEEEEGLLFNVLLVLESNGWNWLPAEEASEVVTGAQPMWPNDDGPVLVSHLLFPGSSTLTS